MEPTLIKVQALAGMMFFIFLVMHLSNTAFAAFGHELYNSLQTTMQALYQHPVFELIFVILPLLSHTIAGVSLVIIRRKNKTTKTSLKYRLHSISGFFLLAVVFAHALATRGIGYFFDAAPGFEGVSFTLWFMPLVFYPYYFVLFMAGFYHSRQGISRILIRNFGVHLNSAHSKRLNQAAAVVVIAALMGFGGLLFQIPDPRDNDYARQYARMLSLDLNTNL